MNIRQDKSSKPDEKIYLPGLERDILYASDVLESGSAAAVVFATGSDTLISGINIC
jgi:hypothetical protein